MVKKKITHTKQPETNIVLKHSLKQIIWLSLLCLVLILCFVFSFKKTTIVVKNGQTMNAVARTLSDKGIIFSKDIFNVIAKITKSNKLKSGIYEFNGWSNTFSILHALNCGSNVVVKITIPEGSTINQVAKILSSAMPIDENKFINIAKEKKLEGYLMPETYVFDPTLSETSIILAMKNEFDKKVSQEMYLRAKEIGMTMDEIIILASIVEKEAVKPGERSIIAGVFYNRLKKRMKLESCATVLYAMGIVKPRLTYQDIKFKSPFNTYLYYGLPPAPICSPGIESIKATLYPAKTKSLYFVARGDGGHLFSETVYEHIKNKELTREKYDSLSKKHEN